MTNALSNWNDVMTSAPLESLGWLLFHSLWQFTLVGLLASATLSLLRRRSASLRYGVLITALAAMLVGQLATWQVMSHSLADDSSLTSASSQNVEVRSVEPTAAPVSTQAGTPRDARPQPKASTPAERLANAFPRASNANEASADDRTPTEAAGLESTLNGRSRFDSTWQLVLLSIQPYLPSIVLVWLCGVLLFSARPALGWLTVLRLRVTGLSAVPPAVQQLFDSAANRMGVKSSVRVFESAIAATPMLIGHFKPLVLLPASIISEMPAAQLESILAHELAHVRRLDYLVNMLQTLMETVFFYHPAVWWLSAQLRREREHCVDDAVVAALACPQEYGRALLALSELAQQEPMYAIGAGGSPLLFRIQRLSGVEPARPIWPSVFVSVLTLSGCLAASAWAWQAQAGNSAAGNSADNKFEYFIAEFKNTPINLPATRIVIDGQGGVKFKAAPLGKYKVDAYQAEFKLTDENQELLSTALASTKWLQAAIDDGGEPQRRNATRFRLTVIRSGKTVSAELLHDQRKENARYLAVLHFLQRLQWQEDARRRLQSGQLSQRNSACRDLNNELKLLHGRPNQEPPYLPILDWRRFEEDLRPVLENRDRQERDQLEAALRLFGHLRDPAAWEHIAFHFRNFRLYSKNNSTPIRDAIVDALVAYGDQRSVDLLAEPVNYFWVNAWGLIRCGDIATPTIVKIIEKGPGEKRDNRFETMFRTYVEKWDQLDAQVDPRVIAAVRASMKDRKVKMFRTKHHQEFLDQIALDKKFPWSAKQGGFSARLQTDRDRWPSGETVKLTAAIRNRSQQRGFVIRSAQAHQLEIDGRYFHIRTGGGKSTPLNAGGVFDNLQVELGADWYDLKSGQRLALTPGEHRIRFLFTIWGDAIQSRQIASNLVKFSVAAPNEDLAAGNSTSLKTNSKEKPPYKPPTERSTSKSKAEAARAASNTNALLEALRVANGERATTAGIAFLQLKPTTPQPKHSRSGNQESWVYRWALKPQGDYALRSDIVIRQHKEPRVRVISGRRHGQLRRGKAEFEFVVNLNAQKQSLQLHTSLTPSKNESPVRLTVDGPIDGSNLADQTALFLPAGMSSGESRVIWEGWYAKGSTYARHVQLVISAYRQSGDAEKGEQAKLKTAIRLNGKLDMDPQRLVGDWQLSSAPGMSRTLTFRSDMTYQLLGEAQGDQKLTSGAWRLEGNSLRLNDKSGADPHWRQTDFWVADARLGNQHLALQSGDDRQIRLHRLVGDMRKGLTNRVQIGSVASQPVFLDQIRPVGFQRSGELNRLFASPAMERYRRKHHDAITPTSDELAALKTVLANAHQKRMQGEYGKVFRERLAEIELKLKQPDLGDEQLGQLQVQRKALKQQIDPDETQWAFTSQWIASRWKFQKHLYDKFGGGRVVWQQAGAEAFDATHRWYKEHEAAGDFKITDEKMRAEFYEYWTDEARHRAFLTDDKQRIRKSFLTPPWEQDLNEG